MSEGIQTVAVIGAGVMGSAIALHLAGAGLDVHLLDIVPEGAAAPRDRNALAAGALERALKAKPAPFFDRDALRFITPGNLEDDLERLARCDLVIEAVVEKMELKQALFSRIAPRLRPDAMLASNTSGLSIRKMVEALPDDVQRRFAVLHFFNPVRYMRLLEVVPGPKTDPAVVARLTRFGEFLGKGVVLGKDTTNFVGNRIGVYGMLLLMHEMERQGLDIESVDAIAGKPLGRPKSAAFGTADVVGIDTLVHVAKNCHDSLTEDPERAVFAVPGFVRNLVEQGRLGRKSGAGFYKKVGPDVHVLDLASGEYRAPRTPEFASLAATKAAKGPGERIAKLIQGDDAAARFAWTVTAKTLAYSAALVSEIADDIVSIDRAMRWGFNWELGPFEVWDAIGVESSVARMRAEGISVPGWMEQMLANGRTRFYAGSVAAPDFFDVVTRSPKPVPRHPKRIELAVLRASNAVVTENAGASLLDLGDGVACLELHTKMNTIDADVIEMLDRAAGVAERDFSALVVANDAEHFCAGANLMMIVGTAKSGDWSRLDGIIRGLQNSLQRLRYSRVPVVSAPCQYTLGGGTELAMASDASQAFAETYMGLVEVGVGLLPAGTGCARMVERYTSAVADLDGVDPLPLIAQASLGIAMAKASGSAEEAKRLRYLRADDGISLNRDFLLFEAKQRALGLAGAGYRPPRPPRLLAAGLDAAKTIGVRIWGLVEGGYASAHDALIANQVARVLCGGDVAAGTLVDEQHFLDLEREAFLSLCGEKNTQARIQHMLETGKPLRN